MKSLFDSMIQLCETGRRAGSLPKPSREPRPAVLLSTVNYSSVSGEEEEAEAMEVGGECVKLDGEH